jgi:hypothetical protein
LEQASGRRLPIKGNPQYTLEIARQSAGATKSERTSVAA